MKKQKQQEYLKAFNNYFPQSDRESGCIKKIKEDLEKIKKITNLEEKHKEANFVWSQHNHNELHVSGIYSAGNLQELGISHKDTIEKYRKLVKELWELNVKTIKELEKQKKSTKQSTNKKSQSKSTQQKN